MINKQKNKIRRTRIRIIIRRIMKRLRGIRRIRRRKIIMQRIRRRIKTH